MKHGMKVKKEKGMDSKVMGSKGKPANIPEGFHKDRGTKTTKFPKM